MIRDCTLSDEKIWTKLNKEFMSFEYEDDNVWENPLSQGNPGEIFEQIIKDVNSANRLFFIEEEDEIIGFMNTAFFLSVWAHGKVLFVDDLFIREPFRAKGYGRKALKELEMKLKDEGYKRIQLMAEDTNPKAVSFYRKANYSQQKINFFCKYI